jgi:hypothetical protein
MFFDACLPCFLTMVDQVFRIFFDIDHVNFAFKDIGILTSKVTVQEYDNVRM